MCVVQACSGNRVSGCNFIAQKCTLTHCNTTVRARGEWLWVGTRRGGTCNRHVQTATRGGVSSGGVDWAWTLLAVATVLGHACAQAPLQALVETFRQTCDWLAACPAGVQRFVWGVARQMKPLPLSEVVWGGCLSTPLPAPLAVWA